MAADFDKPTINGESYVDILSGIRAKFEVVSTMSYGDAVQGSIPTNAVQFLDGRLQKWDGSSFQNAPISITGGGTGASNAAGARVALGVPSIDDLSNNYLSKAGNLSGITDPSLARQVLDVYSEIEVDNAITSTIENELDELFATAEVSAPSGDMISGGIKISRVGDTVIITNNTSAAGFSHSSNSGPESLAIIPLAFRPTQIAFNCYYSAFGDNRTVSVKPDGTINFVYSDSNGSLSPKTSTGGFTISYTV